MKPYLFPLALLALGALSTNVSAGKSPVYLAESLFENTVGLPAQGAFCVSWANIGMPDTEARYEGTQGASYSCKIDFTFRTRQSNGSFTGREQMSSRLVSYNALPTQYRDQKRIGDLLQNRFGYILGEESTGIPYIDIANGALHGLYGAVNLLGDIFSVDVRDKMLRLTPKFNAVNDAKTFACQAISVELLGSACEENKDEIQEDILNRARAAEYWSNLRNGMLPAGRHP